MFFSGNHKVFKSSVPGIGDKDQMHYISYAVTGMLFLYCTTSNALYKEKATKPKDYE